MLSEHAWVIVLDQEAATSQDSLSYHNLAIRELLDKGCHKLWVILINVNKVHYQQFRSHIDSCYADFEVNVFYKLNYKS